MSEKFIVIREEADKKVEIDWKDVENKIQILTRKFSSTIDWRYLDDLQQELRIFAWTTSTNYWDMYRRAVDFYRRLSKSYAESCVDQFDSESGEGGISEETPEKSYDKKEDIDSVRKTIKLLKDAVSEYDNSKVERRMKDNALIILDIIEKFSLGEIEFHTTYGGRLDYSKLYEVTGIDYKYVQEAFWFIQQVVITLNHLNRIEVPRGLHLRNFGSYTPW